MSDTETIEKNTEHEERVQSAADIIAEEMGVSSGTGDSPSDSVETPSASSDDPGDAGSEATPDSGEASASEEPAATAPNYGDFEQYLVRTEDGNVFLRSDLLPESFTGYQHGETDQDRFTRDDMDKRTRKYTTRMAELDNERRANMLGDGSLKSARFDEMQQLLQENPDGFLLETIKEDGLHDPVNTAWQILTQHAPDQAQLLHEAFNQLASSGNYDPKVGEHRANERKNELERQRLDQQSLDVSKRQARLRVESSFSRVLQDAEWTEVDNIFNGMVALHQAQPAIYPDRPSVEKAMELWLQRTGQNTQPAQSTAAPAVAAKPPQPAGTPPPVENPSGTSTKQNSAPPQSSQDIVDEWRAYEAQMAAR